MIMNLVSKIAGPRVMLGVLIFSVVSLCTLGWMLLKAYEGKGEAEAQIAHYRQVANENAEDFSRLAADLIITENTLEDVRQEKENIEGRYRDVIQQNKQEAKQASEEYKACRPVPVPSGVGERMRQAYENANSVSLPTKDSDS